MREKITTVSVDDLLINFPLTHLVVDIEGFERDLILGSVEQISNFHPNFCISVYHYPTDIVTLPLLLSSISEEYTFFL
jgi:hypothetical protein